MNRRRLNRAWTQRGQGLVEYGLILVLIMVVVAFMLGVFGMQVNALFSSVTSAVGGTL